MPEQAPFRGRSLLSCANLLRTCGVGATSLEEVAALVVNQLRDYLVNKETGQPVLPLVRFYITRRCGELPADLQDFARVAGVDVPITSEVTCLALLATAGEEAAWDDRHQSEGHKAIPLHSVQAIRRLPMIARLIEQLGLEDRHVLGPEPSQFRDLSERSYDIFYVEDALDSPYVPAQNNFVIPYGIRSVVGFGGVLPDGALFAVVLFSAAPVPASAVGAFAALALSVKLALLPHIVQKTFVDDDGPHHAPGVAATLRRRLLEAENVAMGQLLDARSKVIDAEGASADRDVSEYEAQAAELRQSQAALALSEARKAAIVDGALDGIVGMDSGGRITEWNRSAERIFGWPRDDAVGRLLSELIIPYSMRPRHLSGLQRFLTTGRGPVIGRRIEVNALCRDGTEIPVELAVTCVDNADPPLFNGYIRDLSAAKDAQRELEVRQERLARIARTLQTSLLPPLLPDIDGFELAAAFRPHGDGYEVGGDFYDAFELRSGRWALALGDVSGKGSDAAAITALARYTIRAAAIRNEDPRSVLSTLNEAINRHELPQFCTAAFVTVQPATGEVSLGLGGHPHPLLISATGAVSAVGEFGPLLGPFEDWAGPVVTFNLAPGDALLLYSDGVTEARRGLNFFGQERLEDTFRGVLGRSAAEIVRATETDVLAFADDLSDDVAVVCARRLPAP